MIEITDYTSHSYKDKLLEVINFYMDENSVLKNTVSTTQFTVLQYKIIDRKLYLKNISLPVNEFPSTIKTTIDDIVNNNEPPFVIRYLTDIDITLEGYEVGLLRLTPELTYDSLYNVYGDYDAGDSFFHFKRNKKPDYKYYTFLKTEVESVFTHILESFTLTTDEEFDMRDYFNKITEMFPETEQFFLAYKDGIFSIYGIGHVDLITNELGK